MCSIDVKVMTSWPFKDVKNLSLSDIHSSLLYGFELSWFTWTTCMYNKSCYFCSGNYGRETTEYCFGNVNYHWTWYVKWALPIVLRLILGLIIDMSKCALVYDFMPNGSLEKYISCQQGRTHSLTWEKKHAITLGVARGIEYLHRGCNMQILHFDIKPHNILLDDNFTPKISDFGLARSYPTGNSIVTITAARGTIGYVAPELINRGIGAVSYKADVYSFGMLLMEMLGLNRDLIQNTELSSQYFPDWIYDRFNKGKDLEIGDADESGCEEMKITRKMTIVALWCIQMNPMDRPSMSKVIEMLESEVETLQIPPQPCQPPLQVAPPEDQTWGTDSTNSIAFLCNASSSVNLAVE